MTNNQFIPTIEHKPVEKPSTRVTGNYSDLIALGIICTFMATILICMMKNKS